MKSLKLKPTTERLIPPTAHAGHVRLERIDDQTDAEIRQAIHDDPDAAPELDAAWFQTAKVVVHGAK